MNVRTDVRRIFNAPSRRRQEKSEPRPSGSGHLRQREQRPLADARGSDQNRLRYAD
jgi:hypothetical protein